MRESDIRITFCWQKSAVGLVAIGSFVCRFSLLYDCSSDFIMRYVTAVCLILMVLVGYSLSQCFIKGEKSYLGRHVLQTLHTSVKPVYIKVAVSSLLALLRTINILLLWCKRVIL